MSLADYTIGGEIAPAVKSKISTLGFDYVIGGEPWDWLLDAETTSTPQHCAATLAGEGTLAGALTTPKRGAAAFTGYGTLAAGLTVNHRLSANLFGAGTLSARMGGSAQELAASLAGAGTISAALTARRTMRAVCAGAGTITGAVSLSKRMATSASGSGTMTVVLTSGLEVAPNGLDIGGPHNPTVSEFANTITQSSFAV